MTSRDHAGIMSDEMASPTCSPGPSTRFRNASGSRCYDARPAMRPLLPWLALLVACVVLGCGSKGRAGLKEPIPPAASTNTPVSLASVVKQSRSAFRRRDAAWLGGGDGYRVRAELAKTTVQLPGGASIALGPPSIERDGVELASATRPIEPQPTGAVSIDRHVARETLENRDGGLEQSWAFDVAPPGREGIVVRVPVLDDRTAARVDRGLRFADPAGGRAILFSDATWVDAEGRRTPVPAVWSRGAIQFDVPAAVVTSSAYPVTLDPTIGPEFPINTAIESVADNVNGATVASTGSQSLVAWITGYNGQSQGILGRRLRSSDGSFVDATPLTIQAPATNSIQEIAAASNGSDYCVFEYSTNLVAYRISGSTGALLGTTTVATGVMGADQSFAATYGGGVYLVAWANYETQGPTANLNFARIDASSGSLLDATPVSLGSATYTESLSAAFDGTNFLVVENTAAVSGAVVGSRVRPNGTVVDAAPVTLVASGSGQSVGVAFGGGAYLLAWEDS
jgi:hypothetical protein